MLPRRASPSGPPRSPSTLRPIFQARSGSGILIDILHRALIIAQARLALKNSFAGTSWIIVMKNRKKLAFDREATHSEGRAGPKQRN
jgi:hypothetical protein